MASKSRLEIWKDAAKEAAPRPEVNEFYLIEENLYQWIRHSNRRYIWRRVPLIEALTMYLNYSQGKGTSVAKWLDALPKHQPPAANPFIDN